MAGLLEGPGEFSSGRKRATLEMTQGCNKVDFVLTQLLKQSRWGKFAISNCYDKAKERIIGTYYKKKKKMLAVLTVIEHSLVAH